MSSQDPAHLSERLAAFRLDPAERSRNAASSSRKWKIAAITGLLVACGLGAWLQARDPAPAVKSAPQRETTQPIPMDARNGESGFGLDVSGFIVARRQATLSSKISGIVTQVFIEEGSLVHKGDPLVLLDDKEASSSVALAEVGVQLARASVLEAENSLRRVEEEMKRSDRLAAEQLISASSYADLRYEVEGLRRSLNSANLVVTQRRRELAVVQASLENTIIRAPFDGIIIATTVQLGEVVAPLSAVGASTRSGIGTIMDPSSLEVSVEVAESFLSRVSRKQAVVVRPDAYPELRIEGVVASVAPMSNRGAASIPIRIRLETLDPRLLPDMAVSVSWVDSHQ